MNIEIGKKALFFLLFGIIFSAGAFAFNPKTNTHFSFEENLAERQNIQFIQENSIVAVAESFYTKPEQIKKVRAIITAYSSSPDETWGDPFITASGQITRNGIVANNCLPFGTIVEINGVEFEVQDRKNARYGCEWFDIWQPSKQEALNFGIKKTYANIILDN